MAPTTELAVSFLYGELAGEEFVELCARMRTEDASVDEFVVSSFLENELRQRLSEPQRHGQVLDAIDHELAQVENTEREPAGPARLGAWSESAWEWFIQPMTLSALVSGLVMTIILLSMALWVVPDWRPGAPVAEQRSIEFVARITKTSQASFDKTSGGNFQNRDLFDDDKVVLVSGLAVIEYDTGARVVLEGPVTYHVAGANGGDLRDGKLVAQVDASAIGFTVGAPLFRVVDLGTEFGMDVGIDGTSQVAVLEGSVDVVRCQKEHGSKERVRLGKGEVAFVAERNATITRRGKIEGRFAAELRDRLRELPGTAASVRSAPLSIGTVIGVDFGPTAPTNSFNQAAATSSYGSLAPGRVIDTSNLVVDGVGFSWAGNLRPFSNNDADETQAAQPAAFNTSNLTDWLGMSDDKQPAPGVLTLRFTGLDDSFTYNLVIGAAFSNSLPDTIWKADGQTTTAFSSADGQSYVRFTGLKTDGSGTLVITGTGTGPRADIAAVAALELIAVQGRAAD